MGVSGSGKTRIAKAISKQWGYVYIEADDLHSAQEIEKMASGRPLDDEDRLPWLRRVGERIREEESIGRRTVTACSALKRAYGDILREYAPTHSLSCLSVRSTSWRRASSPDSTRSCPRHS